MIKNFKYIWVAGLLFTLVLVVTPIYAILRDNTPEVADPWASIEQALPATDHSALLPGPYETGSDVTRACLECHEEEATDFMQTVHWTWESEPLKVPGRDSEELVTVGKKNQLNNFCIGIEGNWSKCTSCHAGYGWEDASFDFADAENVDCLVCHADTGLYAKGEYGNPAQGVDLAAAAQSVTLPNRQNCGSCHFNGGGGNAVKHGDLDQTLIFPNENVDVHMGRHDFTCTTCHKTEAHQVSGSMMSSSPIAEDRVACADCHQGIIHADERINSHLDSIACQTCHIPTGAVREATKMDWDWSTAGQDLGIDDPHLYLKIKGSFVYEDNFTPTYAWFNGDSYRYIKGDPLEPVGPTYITYPMGDINDPGALIWPFKVHNARQPYDPVNNYLLIPNTAGEGGFWSDFDWDFAFESNQENTGLAYSGEYGFAETQMYWNLSHMVQPKESALRCSDCHSESGRMDWEALGYYGDPLRWGGRAPAILEAEGEAR